jgi:hypothetical protein
MKNMSERKTFVPQQTDINVHEHCKKNYIAERCAYFSFSSKNKYLQIHSKNKINEMFAIYL